MREIRLECSYTSVTGLLNRIISSESKYVELQRQTLKEDEFTILRLQNKARILDIEIEKRDKLIEEYRCYLKDISRNKFYKDKANSIKMDTRDTKLLMTKF